MNMFRFVHDSNDRPGYGPGTSSPMPFETDRQELYLFRSLRNCLYAGVFAIALALTCADSWALQAIVRISVLGQRYELFCSSH